MSAMTERLSVIIDAQSGGAVRAFDQASRASGKFSKEAQHQTVQIGRLRVSHQQLAAGLKAGIATAAVSAAYGLARLSKVSIAAARDEVETQNKVKVVFGESADAVLKFGDTAAKTLGESKQQAGEAAASFGNFFLTLGIGPKRAADMSIAMVKLSSDLASFNNVDPSEMLTKLQAGLAGQSRPLRQYGIDLSAATIKQEALDLGLVKTASGTLPTSIKAQAAYALILKQTTTAQGDFARTSGGLANQQRILAAQVSDAEAALGQELLPIELKLIGVANDLLPAVKGVAAAMGNEGVQHAVEFAAALYGINKAMKIYKAIAASDLITTIARLALGHTANATAIAAEGTAATVTAAELEGLTAAEAGSAVAAAGAGSRLGGLALAFGRLAPQIAIAAAAYASYQDITQKDSSGLSNEDKRQIAHLESGGKKQVQDFLNSFSMTNPAATKALKDFVGDVKQIPPAADAATGAERKLAGAHAEDAAAAGKAAAKERDLLNARIATFNSAIAYQRSELAVVDALAGVRKAASDAATAERQHGRSSAAAKAAHEAYKKSILDAKDALLSEADAAVQTASDNAAARGRTLSAARSQAIYRGELDKLANKLSPGSPLRQYLLGLIDDLDRAAKPRTETFTITTIGHGPGSNPVGYAPPGQRRPHGAARGGAIRGAGTGTSDSIPAMLSNGEYVVRADGSNLGAAMRHFGMPGYAGGGAIGSSAAGVVSGNLPKSIDKLSAVVRGAFDHLSSVIQSAKDYRSSTKAGLADYANITGAAGSGVGAVTYERAKANDLRKFARLYNQLERRGLNPTMLGQFVQAGPAAIPAMEELLRTHGAIRDVNRLQRQVNRTSGSIASAATSDQFGPRIAKGIEALPDRFERAVGRAIERNLRIDVHVHENGRVVVQRRRAG